MGAVSGIEIHRLSQHMLGLCSPGHRGQHSESGVWSATQSPPLSFCPELRVIGSVASWRLSVIPWQLLGGMVARCTFEGEFRRFESPTMHFRSWFKAPLEENASGTRFTVLKKMLQVDSITHSV